MKPIYVLRHSDTRGVVDTAIPGRTANELWTLLQKKAPNSWAHAVEHEGWDMNLWACPHYERREMVTAICDDDGDAIGVSCLECGNDADTHQKMLGALEHYHKFDLNPTPR